MLNENMQPPSIADMLRITGGNTSVFMEQVALHVEKLEEEVGRLTTRINELESKEVSK